MSTHDTRHTVCDVMLTHMPVVSDTIHSVCGAMLTHTVCGVRLTHIPVVSDTIHSVSTWHHTQCVCCHVDTHWVRCYVDTHCVWCHVDTHACCQWQLTFNSRCQITLHSSKLFYIILSLLIIYNPDIIRRFWCLWSSVVSRAQWTRVNIKWFLTDTTTATTGIPIWWSDWTLSRWCDCNRKENRTASALRG